MPRIEQGLLGHEPNVQNHYTSLRQKALINVLQIAKIKINVILYKTVFQLHVPVQLPCYDFVPVKSPPEQISSH